MIVDGLFKEIDRTPGYQAEINLESQLILLPDGRTIPFEIDAFLKKCLLEGLDDISLTFEKKALITSYEDRRRKEAPWLFPDMTA
jgi:3-isopropylmalate/(R)-2-methylmalate dehydratase small subunit